MINRQLLNPKSIVVIGGSNDTTKPGGKILKHILEGGYKGKLYVVNLKDTVVLGLPAFRDITQLPEVELAILAVAAKYSPEIVRELTEEKNTRAFIIISAGFSEENESGRALEKMVLNQINRFNAALIGPNCTGVLTPCYHGIFTQPVPKLDPKGCDFISGSGATACYIMEAGILRGLTFANVFTVGNSAQMGCEEVLQYLDENFDPDTSSRVKLLYLEKIDKPVLLLKHAASLIRKGCHIAAIKAGSSEAGSRAASSHTGAIASPDFIVDALFRKAGIVRCQSRTELVNVAAVFMHPPMKGKNIAVVTHAGGPAVMLTDTLSHAGLSVPTLSGPGTEELKSKLYAGSSISNPIDFLATGTAEQLGLIIDFVNEKLDQIDGMVVIFGSPGLVPIFDVYELLGEKMKTTDKPIYPVLPSMVTAEKEVKAFLAKGGINFPDEVALGSALALVHHTPGPAPDHPVLPEIDLTKIRSIIDNTGEGYMPPGKVMDLLLAAGIPAVGEIIARTPAEAIKAAQDTGFPLVMKVVGPLHKTEVGGVLLSVNSMEMVEKEFDRMMRIPVVNGVLFQPMLSGIELFTGVKREEKFGHVIFCGLGGIFIEVLKDISSGIAPLSHEEALDMIRRLKSYRVLEGYRGRAGINLDKYAGVITRLSALTGAAPEIYELDLNPLISHKDEIVAVDARINLKF